MKRSTRKHRALARPWLNQLDEMVDARFFEDLQEEFEAAEHDRSGHPQSLADGRLCMASSTAPEPCSTTRRTPCHAQPSTATRLASTRRGCSRDGSAATTACRSCSTKQMGARKVTTVQSIKSSGTQEQQSGPLPWGDVAVNLCQPDSPAC